MTDLFWLKLGLWLVAAASVVITGVALAARKKALLIEAQLKSELAELRRELHVVGSGAMGVGQRLMDVEKRVNQTAERQQEMQQKDVNSLPYQQASKLLEMGASVDDLVSSCGLARAEAELVALVHQQAKQPQ